MFESKQFVRLFDTETSTEYDFDFKSSSINILNSYSLFHVADILWGVYINGPQSVCGPTSYPK